MGDIDWLDQEWMRHATRGQAILAVAYSLHEQAHAIRTLEEGCIRANGGGRWDASAKRRYCALRATACALDLFHMLARDIAIEVASANKAEPREFHRMPPAIDAVGDQLIRSFVEPIDELPQKPALCPPDSHPASAPSASQPPASGGPTHDSPAPIETAAQRKARLDRPKQVVAPPLDVASADLPAGVTHGGGKKFDIQLSQSFIDERRLADVLGRHKLERFELKSERWQWERTGNICIEVERDGMPSGLAVTEADWWVHELARGTLETLAYIFLPVPRLKMIVALARAQGRVSTGGGDGGRQTNVLLKLADILA